MKYRNLGTSGLKVSAVSLGSWLTLGQTVGQEKTGDIVKAALDSGINLFDTADIYGRGAAEIALGKALQDSRREHLVLASKVYWPMSEDANDRGLSRKHLFESCHASLRRLGTDYLDLYQCHRYDEETPLAETVRAMGDLVQQGKILYWGTSMWSASQLREACMLADQMGAPRPVSEQPRYNLLHREIEAELRPACDKLGIGLLVWSPLAQGLLTGKYVKGEPPPRGSRGADEQTGQWLKDDLASVEGFKLVERLEEAAAIHRVPLSRLALAWCLRHESVASAIVGATRQAQVSQNASAADLDWSVELEHVVEGALAVA